MNKDNDRRSRLRLPQVFGVVRETSTSAQAVVAPNACAARNSTVDPSTNAAPKLAPARRFKLVYFFQIQYLVNKLSKHSFSLHCPTHLIVVDIIRRHLHRLKGGFYLQDFFFLVLHIEIKKRCHEKNRPHVIALL
jgi:hypothetical protein